MSGNFKRINSSLFAVCHEVTEGTANYERVATGIGSTTTFVDASTPGIDDEWKGYYLYFKDGVNAGLVRKITGYTSATGTFTFASVPSAFSVSDEAVLAVALPAKVSAPSKDIDKQKREIESETYDKPSHVMGLKTNSLSFDLEAFGCETPSADASAAESDRLSILLEGLGTVVQRVGDSVQAAPSPTTTTFTVADGTQFNKNEVCMVEGQARVISAVATNAITVKPALNTAPSASSVVYNNEITKPAEEGQRSFTFLWLRDDQLTELRGCHINVKGVFKWGDKIMFQIEAQGTGWEEYDSYALSGEQSVKKPFAWVSGGVLYDLDSSVALPIQEAEFDFGVKMEEDRNSVDGNIINVGDRDSTCRVKFKNTSKTQKDNEVSGKKAEVLLQVGNSAGACIAMWFQGQYDSLGDADNAGIAYHDGQLNHFDDNEDADNAMRMILARF